MLLRRVFILAAMLTVSFAYGKEEINLASTPAVSPDGETLVFYWLKQLWKVSTNGGNAEQITHHPAGSGRPIFTADGKNLIFSSGREDGWQIYQMPVEGGAPQKITSHTDGYTPLDVYPDGKSVLASVWRNYGGLIGQRMVKVSLDGSQRDKTVFDDYGSDGRVSPDGTKILFTRDGFGISDYRQGYLGSTAAQIWIYDTATGEFSSMLKERYGNRDAIWRPDGKAFYYCSEASGSYNIWQYELKSGKRKQLTFLKDSPVLLPTLSQDGKTMVFRHLFDFYRFNPRKANKPEVIKIYNNIDMVAKKSERRWFDKIWNEEGFGQMDFTDDGLEVAFTAGGDLYVMDTVLRKPVAVDAGSSFQIVDLAFAPDFKTIYYLKDTGDAVNIWSAKVVDDSKYWWENKEFTLKQITDGKENLSSLSVSPDGNKLAYFKRRAALCVADLDGKNEKLIKEGPYTSYYTWAPDSKHMLGTFQSDSRNTNIWVLTIDGSTEPFNLSRTPGWCGQASWSPDGKIITYVNARTKSDRKTFLNWVYLDKADDELTGTDRTLEKAVQTMEGVRGKREKDDPSPRHPHEDEPINGNPKGHPQSVADAKSKEIAKEPVDEVAKQDVAKQVEKVTEEDNGIEIDFSDLYERVHSKSFNWSNPWGFFWSWDSKALAFSGTVDGRFGTYKMFFPDNIKPHFMTSRAGWYAKWVKGGKILWMVDGYAAQLDNLYKMKVYQVVDVEQRQRLTFRKIWRGMRDNFCDPDIKNLDWDGILKKYEDMAAKAPDEAVFDRLVGMLLGELNASHLGWTRKKSAPSWRSRDWKVETLSLGVRFDENYVGDGVKVSSVTMDGPADKDRSRLYPGDIILSIDGKEIAQNESIYPELTDRPGKEFELSVMNKEGETRTVAIKAITYGTERRLVKEQTIKQRRTIVEKISKGKLGYLNIEEMNNPSLRRFEKEVYSEGFGKDGLVIDVRNNPGGFISDYLLAILCHPQHAVTIPRGGGQSFPDGYLPNVVWNKPIVVLCNQYSCSNAEIFSHAIKTLKRGKLVGVETQACVISTPHMDILDVGDLAIPDRAWWPLGTLVDMEKQGAVPDYIIWPQPGDMPKGIDRQLEKAVEVLLDDVKNEPKPPVLIRQGHDK